MPSRGVISIKVYSYTHCWLNVVPALQTLAQHSTNSGRTSLFCRDTWTQVLGSTDVTLCPAPVSGVTRSDSWHFPQWRTGSFVGVRISPQIQNAVTSHFTRIAITAFWFALHQVGRSVVWCPALSPSGSLCAWLARWMDGRMTRVSGLLVRPHAATYREDAWRAGIDIICPHHARIQTGVYSKDHSSLLTASSLPLSFRADREAWHRGLLRKIPRITQPATRGDGSMPILGVCVD